MVRVAVLHVAVAARDLVEALEGKVDHLHVPEAAEDLHDVLLRHVPAESADVDAQRPGSHRALAPLLSRRPVPRAAAILLVLLVQRRAALVVLLVATAARLAVPGAAAERVRGLFADLFVLVLEALAAGTRRRLPLGARTVAGAGRRARGGGRRAGGARSGAAAARTAGRTVNKQKVGLSFAGSIILIVYLYLLLSELLESLPARFFLSRPRELRLLSFSLSEDAISAKTGDLIYSIKPESDLGVSGVQG